MNHDYTKRAESRDRAPNFLGSGFQRGFLWCRGVAVKCVDSHHRCCQFDSSRCHNKDVLARKATGKPPRAIPLPRKNSKLCIWFLLRSKSSMQRRFPVAPPPPNDVFTVHRGNTISHAGTVLSLLAIPVSFSHDRMLARECLGRIIRLVMLRLIGMVAQTMLFLTL